MRSEKWNVLEIKALNLPLCLSFAQCFVLIYSKCDERQISYLILLCVELADAVLKSSSDREVVLQSSHFRIRI